MGDNPILHYLPTGWTEEMYQNQTDAALEALSEQVSLVHGDRSKRKQQKQDKIQLSKFSVQSPVVLDANMTRNSKI
ncbi:hypothetical protein BJX65DRAFT_270595 [Aspergillus insuetus]